MEFDDIRAFVAVADTGSVSGAATELFLTQPAVTRRLQRLETSLGTPLLDRRRRPFALTEAGQAVLEQCRRVLNSVQELRVVTAGDSLPVGELRVGVAHALTEMTLTAPVDQVRRAFPQVTLRLSTGWSRKLLERVRSGTLDAAVILLPEGEQLPSGVSGEQTAQERLVVVAPRQASSRRVHEITELAGVNWILNPEGCAARIALQRALLRANVNMRVAVETYNYDLQLSLVARKRGLSLAPYRIMARSQYSPRLCVLRVRGLDFPMTMWTVRGQLTTGLDGVVAELNRELIARLSGPTRRRGSK
jgi:DNA-binding transcriptional LysR family regulator